MAEITVNTGALTCSKAQGSTGTYSLRVLYAVHLNTDGGRILISLKSL